MFNVERLVAQMDAHGIEALVATSSENVRYLTGIDSVALEMFPHTGHCFAVISRADPARPNFVSSRCEVDQFLDAAWPLSGARAYGPFTREVGSSTLTVEEKKLKATSVDEVSSATPLEALVQTLKELGVSDGSRLAIDQTGVAARFTQELAEVRRPGAVVDATRLLRNARKVKTDAELVSVAEAAKAAEQGIAAATAIVKPGVTERELVREFEVAVARIGGRPKFTLIKFGRAAVAGQMQPTDIPLAVGQTIWFDVGGVVSGYWYDIARVFSLREPPAKAMAYYGAILAGEQRAIDEARPGMTGRELFNLTVEAVRESGVPHYQRHHVGHGIGVEVYDDVLITPSSDEVIEDGTVVNIETPYYEFGFGAVHVEDPFVVTGAGNRILTSMPRTLEVLGE
jgi:Xaa-Pro aminopeptidase